MVRAEPVSSDYEVEKVRLKRWTSRGKEGGWWSKAALESKQQDKEHLQNRGGFRQQFRDYQWHWCFDKLLDYFSLPHSLQF